MYDENERKLFEQEMAGVSQLKQHNNNTADVSKPSQGPSEAQLARREAAAAEGDQLNFLSDEFVEVLRHDEPLSFRRNGIQRGLIDKLAQGGYAIESQLNLLRRPLEECRREIFTFIHDAQQHQLRSLLIIHGRGREDTSPANIIRSYLAKWLIQLDAVHAFCSAQPRNGGIGATYVVLQKSEQQRQRNRDRHLNRKG